MKTFLKKLAPLRNKIHLRILISTVLTASGFGFAVNAVLVLLSKIIYIYGVNDKIVIIFISAVSLGLISGLFLRPSALKCAKTADALGGKERFITALDIIENKKTGDMASSVVADAESYASTADFCKAYSIKPHKCIVIGTMIAFLAFLIVCFLPLPPSEKLEEQQEIHEKYDDAIEKMKKDAEETNLTDKQKTKVNKELSQLKKELARAKTKTEAVDSLMKSQSQLKKISDESENATLKELSTRLSENESTQHLGEALKSGNIEDFNEQLQKINENLKNMSDEELKRLGKALKQAAGSNNIDSETKELLDELADTLDSELTDEQLESLSNSMSEFSDRINQLAKENSDIREAVKKLNEDMSKLDESSKRGSSKKGSQNTDDKRKTGDGQSGQEGTGSETGGNGQKGDGQGQQQGKGGEAGSNGQSGNGIGKGSIANADIYTSEAKDYADYDAELDGNGGAKGKSNGEKTVDGADGQIIPYTDVFSNYKNEAMDSIDKEDIPYGVKDIVRDYFSSLE